MHQTIDWLDTPYTLILEMIYSFEAFILHYGWMTPPEGEISLPPLLRRHLIFNSTIPNWRRYSL